MYLTLIIPVYNEAENLILMLPDWIKFCSANDYHLIIVNDGSIDNTKEILTGYQSERVFSVIHHKVNRGYGAALKTGILHSKSDYVATMDADGQHTIEDIGQLIKVLKDKDADMVIGSRKGKNTGNIYRKIGKNIIRGVARLLMRVPVYDINSGMKIYDCHIAKKYLKMCPDSMAFSDIITLVFINQGRLVVEHPITIKPRKKGNSSINSFTAIETIQSIINMVVLFNPLRVFLPIALFCFLFGLGWGLPIMIRGEGVSVGSMLGIVTGTIIFFMGLIASQLSSIRKERLNNGN